MSTVNSILQTSNISLVKRIPEIKINNKTLGKLVTVCEEKNYSTYETKLQNESGKTLGYELFYIDENDSSVLGYSIGVDSNYRKKGYNLGEILRLSSIITMIENKISLFQIYSISKAIFFHSKYKFVPEISNIIDASRLLTSVVNNCKEERYQTIKEDAENLLIDIIVNQGKVKNNSLLCKKTEELLNDYIQTVLQSDNKDEYKSHIFSTGLNMNLTLENIYKHKNFFNSLLEKHNIDYKI